MAKTARKWIELDSPFTNTLALSAGHILHSDLRDETTTFDGQISLSADILAGNVDFPQQYIIPNLTQDVSQTLNDAWDNIYALNKCVKAINDTSSVPANIVLQNGTITKPLMIPTFDADYRISDSQMLSANYENTPMGVAKKILPSEFVVDAKITTVLATLGDVKMDDAIDMRVDRFVASNKDAPGASPYNIKPTIYYVPGTSDLISSDDGLSALLSDKRATNNLIYKPDSADVPPEDNIVVFGNWSSTYKRIKDGGIHISDVPSYSGFSSFCPLRLTYDNSIYHKHNVGNYIQWNFYRSAIHPSQDEDITIEQQSTGLYYPEWLKSINIFNIRNGTKDPSTYSPIISQIIPYCRPVAIIGSDADRYKSYIKIEYSQSTSNPEYLGFNMEALSINLPTIYWYDPEDSKCTLLPFITDNYHITTDTREFFLPSSIPAYGEVAFDTAWPHVRGTSYTYPVKFRLFSGEDVLPATIDDFLIGVSSNVNCSVTIDGGAYTAISIAAWNESPTKNIVVTPTGGDWSFNLRYYYYPTGVEFYTLGIDGNRIALGVEYASVIQGDCL